MKEKRKTIEVRSIEADGGGLYASTDMINNRMDYKRLEKYDIWVAQYSSVCTCKIPYGVWQYSSSGSVAGITGRVDMDRAYKDYPGLVTGALANGAASEQQLPTGREDTPPRTTATIHIGPMTGGDLDTIIAKAKELGLYRVGEIDIGPMTDGDKKTIKDLADSLGLSIEEA